MSQRAKLALAAVLMAATLALAVRGAGSLVPWLLCAVAASIPVLLRQQACEDFVVWKDDYSVRIDTIDQDHKKLLGLINNLLAAKQCRTGPEFERQAPDELIDYTQFHFKPEEDLMWESGYADYEGHKAPHHQMVTQARLFRSHCEEKGRKAIPAAARHLKLWLLQRINGTDEKYVPFLRARLGQ